MSKVNQVKCDFCGRRADTTYNGEHHLAPQGWFQLYDDNRSNMTDLHICDKCVTTNKKDGKNGKSTSKSSKQKS